MNEDLLYFVWKHQQFNKGSLTTVSGNNLSVIKPGLLNTDSGPDFSEAHIHLDEISWYGQVEIHVKASDWNLHQHQNDPAFNNVVLHVVWDNDQEVCRQDGSQMPTLELQNWVTKDLLSKYKLLKETLDPVPCKRQVRQVPEVKTLSMIERCTTERLEAKAMQILALLEKNKGDWEETAYQVTLKYLGFKTNSAPMEQLGKMLSYKLLKKNSNNQLAVEALIFGQAGLLNGSDDHYSKTLRTEYEFLRRKYDLQEPVKSHTWKFMRMRPANFPTLRLAQWAAIICNNPTFFDLYINELSMKTFRAYFQAVPSEYWMEHYHFNKKIKLRDARMGISSIYLLLINVVCPLRAAYSIKADDYRYMDDALSLLGKCPFEKNKYTRTFNELPFPNKSAFDSQGMITLFNNYCAMKKCLNCDIGTTLLQ